MAAEIGAVSVQGMHEVNRPKHVMATVINIERPATRKSGRDIARVEDVEGEAALSFTIRGPALISANHNLEPVSMRGTSAAMVLVERMIANASANRFTIIPIFPCVLSQF